MYYEKDQSPKNVKLGRKEKSLPNEPAKPVMRLNLETPYNITQRLQAVTKLSQMRFCGILGLLSAFTFSLIRLNLCPRVHMKKMITIVKFARGLKCHF